MFQIFHGIGKQSQRVGLVCAGTIILISMSVHFSGQIAPLDYESTDFRISSLLKPTAKKIQKQNTHIQKSSIVIKKTCGPMTALNETYLEKSAQELKNTNNEIDNLRQTAQNSGESYQSFDTQANTIFSAYDQQVTLTYNAYTAALNGCQADEPPPIIFSMFTP